MNTRYILLLIMTLFICVACSTGEIVVQEENDTMGKTEEISDQASLGASFCTELIEVSSSPCTAKVSCPAKDEKYYKVEEVYNNCVAGTLPGKEDMDLVYTVFQSKLQFKCCLGTALYHKSGLAEKNQ